MNCMAYRKSFQHCMSFATVIRRKMSGYLHSYEPPNWVKDLKCVPKYRVQLAHQNTPIHKWNIPGVPASISVHIKRDDMTGSTLSGNKVRKLEFLLADAIDKGCRHVITAGGIQSNHCRAVAVACRQLGLTPHLLLRSDITDPTHVGSHGNVLVNRLCGAYMYMVPRKAPYEIELRPRSEQLARMIKQDSGEESYLIPIGGSDKVGLFGYITMFQELITQGVQDEFDDLVFTCGSGGTAAGLCIANYLTGSKIKIHGVIVSDTEQYFYDHVQEMLVSVGLGDVKSEDIIDIIGGYMGKGYGISTEEELEFIREVSLSTGILLDPTYTGKAAYGLVKELNTNSGRFTGNRILFLHTGGMFGLFDGRMDALLTKANSSSNRIQMWLNKDSNPV